MLFELALLHSTYLKVLCDHLQCDLENSLKDLGHFRHHALLQLVDDGSEQAEHFSVPDHDTNSRMY